MMGGTSAPVQPAAPADAARGHAAAPKLKCVQGAAVERAFDLDRAPHARRAADRQIPSAVDRKARMARQPLREHIREQALRQATAVELHARRALHNALGPVHRDLPPQL